jgi:hypothetical protein
MSKHTPGPWWWQVYWSEDGLPLALLLTTPDRTKVITAIREDHAFWEGYKEGSWNTTPDARLIAAAPDLLAAVEEAIATLAVQADSERFVALLSTLARASIKAEGKEAKR